MCRVYGLRLKVHRVVEGSKDWGLQSIGFRVLQIGCRVCQVQVVYKISCGSCGFDCISADSIPGTFIWVYRHTTCVVVNTVLQV